MEYEKLLFSQRKEDRFYAFKSNFIKIPSLSALSSQLCLDIILEISLTSVQIWRQQVLHT